MGSNKKKSVQEIAQDKEQKIMETVAWRAAYYRANPERFVLEVLGIHLKLFLKILIWAMMHYNYFMFIAARGLGGCCNFRQGKELKQAVQMRQEAEIAKYLNSPLSQ